MPLGLTLAQSLVAESVSGALICTQTLGTISALEFTPAEACSRQTVAFPVAGAAVGTLSSPTVGVGEMRMTQAVPSLVITNTVVAAIVQTFNLRAVSARVSFITKASSLFTDAIE